MTRTEEKTFMLVRKGAVTRIPWNGERWWPIFSSREDAKRFSEEMLNDKTSIAEIGTVKDETFEKLIRAAIEEGCHGMCKVVRWTSEGNPEMKEVRFDKH